jgi:cytochrome c-type biogenesis protein CcmH
MSMRLIVVAALALVLATPASAAGRPSLARLEHEVMCPTCHQLLELSHAPVAERIRSFIRGRIAAGDTEARIKAELVDEFGPAVLASPPASGFGLFAWLLPLVALLGSAAAVGAVARRWRRAHSDLDEAPLAPGVERWLDRELAAFEELA